MVILSMMVLSLGMLVRGLFLFALNNLLVVLATPLVMLMILLIVFVAWYLEFLFR